MTNETGQINKENRINTWAVSLVAMATGAMTMTAIPQVVNAKEGQTIENAQIFTGVLPENRTVPLLNGETIAFNTRETARDIAKKTIDTYLKLKEITEPKLRLLISALKTFYRDKMPLKVQNWINRLEGELKQIGLGINDAKKEARQRVIKQGFQEFKELFPSSNK